MRKSNPCTEIFSYGIVFLFIGISIFPLSQGLSTKINTSIPDSSEMKNVVMNSEFVNWTVNGTMGEGDWYISPITLTCTYDHDVIAYVYYRYDDNGWMEYVEPFTIGNQGYISLDFYAVDYEGNIETTEVLPFRIDYTHPYVNLSVENIGIMKWLFSTIAGDDISGVIYIEYYLDDQFLTNIPSIPYEYIWTGNGKHLIKVIVYDAAGNNASDTTTTPDIFSHSYQSHLLINHHTYNQRNQMLQNQLFLKILKRYQSNI